jgi:hypothetical protein
VLGLAARGRPAAPDGRAQRSLRQSGGVEDTGAMELPQASASQGPTSLDRAPSHPLRVKGKYSIQCKNSGGRLTNAPELLAFPKCAPHRTTLVPDSLPTLSAHLHRTCRSFVGLLSIPEQHGHWPLGTNRKLFPADPALTRAYDAAGVAPTAATSFRKLCERFRTFGRISYRLCRTDAEYDVQEQYLSASASDSATRRPT